MNAVDTNVLVYSVDHDEPDKQAKAIALLDQLTQPPVETLLLWQVAGEYLIGPSSAVQPVSLGLLRHSDSNQSIRLRVPRQAS